MRSLLFVPGNKDNMLRKALGCRPDVLVPDMEDSVPEGEKRNARLEVQAFLPQLARTGALVFPRVNALDTPWADEDAAAVVGPHADGISIGKVRGPGDIAAVSRMLDEHEAAAGVAVGSTRLIPWIETCEGVVHCHAICTASARIAGVAFGAEDYTHDLGVERLDDPAQLLYARSAVCTAARAANVPALETPYFKLRDVEGLEADSRAAKHLGFKGRFAIHPDQIDAINACFSPSADEIAHAERVVAAYEEAEQRGRGSTSLDGLVIDVPVVKRARATLELARLARENTSRSRE